MIQCIESFYDDFSRRLVRDYVHGNRRLESAILYALSWIPPDAELVLDVGCGIGWSTSEISRHTRANVVGVDISSKMISVARGLFSGPRLQFHVGDIAQGIVRGDAYDAIVMLDVYEHIPMERRSEAHSVLRTVLADPGLLILSYPSVSYQRFLQSDCPSELQPVDEIVTPDDLDDLAHDVNGQLVHHETVTLWRPGDYRHAVIARGDIAHPLMPRRRGLRRWAVEPQRIRDDRVRTRLGVFVTPHGILLPRGHRTTICVIWPSVNAYSEMFIRTHVERMQANVKLLHGGHFPFLREDNRPLFPSRLFGQRGARFLSEWLARRPIESLRPGLLSELRDGLLARFLSRERVSAVLAEFGPTGAAVANACLATEVPLIVHFHGFDAYANQILEAYQTAYQQMFDIAETVVVVSRDMERQLLELGAPKEKVVYNPCGADTALFAGASPASAPPVFIAVGRFVEKKAPHLTLLAFAEVLRDVPDARLVMIGDGVLWDACRQLAEGLDIAHAVDFQGSKRYHSEVGTAMRGARAFVQHSMRTSSGDSEGTPVAVIEAGATGLPVVATRHGGIPDVVIDGETGYLVNEGDVEGMAERMLLLAKSPELAERLGSAARERIRGIFSIERSVSNLWKIIKGAIDRRRGDRQ